MSAIKRRAGLVVAAGAVIVGALTAPALAASVALHHPSNTGASGSAGSSTDLIWTGGVILAVIVVVGAVVFNEQIRDRARSIVGARRRTVREVQARPQS
jgi:hypothetical protein